MGSFSQPGIVISSTVEIAMVVFFVMSRLFRDRLPSLIRLNIVKRYISGTPHVKAGSSGSLRSLHPAGCRVVGPTDFHDAPQQANHRNLRLDDSFRYIYT